MTDPGDHVDLESLFLATKRHKDKHNHYAAGTVTLLQIKATKLRVKLK